MEAGQLPERGEQIVHNCRNQRLDFQQAASQRGRVTDAHILLWVISSRYVGIRGYPCGARASRKKPPVKIVWKLRRLYMCLGMGLQKTVSAEAEVHCPGTSRS